MHTGGGAEEEVDRLAAVMDAEVRAEQAAYEAMALQGEWRARSLADVARELLARGDVVEIRVLGRPLTGSVVFAGQDYLTVRTPRGAVDVVLARCDLLRVVHRVREGGRSPGRGAQTFRARMTEHETTGQRLRLLVTGEGEVEGVVQAMAVDHVLLQTGGGQVVVPEGHVVAAWSEPEVRQRV